MARSLVYSPDQTTDLLVQKPVLPSGSPSLLPASTPCVGTVFHGQFCYNPMIIEPHTLHACDD